MSNVFILLFSSTFSSFCYFLGNFKQISNAWMAERSKAVDLSSIIVRCVGSNPTPGIFAINQGIFDMISCPSG